MSIAVESAKFADKKLPTNWVPSKKPPYREVILLKSQILIQSK